MGGGEERRLCSWEQIRFDEEWGKEDDERKVRRNLVNYERKEEWYR